MRFAYVAALAMALFVVLGSLGPAPTSEAAGPLPLPLLSVPGSVSVIENVPGGKVFITASLSQPAAEPVSFSYMLGGGNAEPGQDYEQIPGHIGTATIPVGQTSVTLAIPIVADYIAEPNEMFNFIMSGPLNAVMGNNSTTIWINQPDPNILLSVPSASAWALAVTAAGMAGVSAWALRRRHGNSA